MPARIVALGASNLTRGLQSVVAVGRERYGRDVEIVAALGHGRSYGADSQFLARSLPGILQSGIWRALDSLPTADTMAIVSDVGNDILYQHSPAQILDWVRAVVDQLERHTKDIVIAGLPNGGIAKLSPAKFTVFRSILFPSCRLSLGEVTEAAATVEAGLIALATSRRLRFVPMRSEWYSFDPIHIRPSLWQPVWRHLLTGESVSVHQPLSHLEWIQVYRLRPERRRMFGVEQITPQHGHRLPLGGRVWLF